MLRKIIVLTAIFVVTALPLQALEQETGFIVKCEPVELSDVTRVIKNVIYDALAANPDMKSKSIQTSLKIIDKNQTIKTLSELTSGEGIDFDSDTLALSIGGMAMGHQCYATALVTIDIVAQRRSTGEIISNSITTEIRFPGAYSTKNRVKVYVEPSNYLRDN
ncbi:MAG: hypothetical protein KDD62_03155 [Bdellovibrionales bacterium]|nr:hypothetical protein [Bdellovibrionales bacterium]